MCVQLSIVGSTFFPTNYDVIQEPKSPCMDIPIPTENNGKKDGNLFFSVANFNSFAMMICMVFLQGDLQGPNLLCVAICKAPLVSLGDGKFVNNILQN